MGTAQAAASDGQKKTAQSVDTLKKRKLTFSNLALLRPCWRRKANSRDRERDSEEGGEQRKGEVLLQSQLLKVSDDKPSQRKADIHSTTKYTARLEQSQKTTSFSQ